MSTAAEFRDHLTSFSELYASLGEKYFIYMYIIFDNFNVFKEKISSIEIKKTLF